MAKMGRPKKRIVRGQSKHPGIHIVTRKVGGDLRHFARWADPELSRCVPLVGEDGAPLIDKRTGRTRTRMIHVRVELSLDLKGLKSDKARETWCKARSKKLQAQAAAIAAGVDRPKETPVVKAIASYYRAKGRELQPATLRAYRQGTVPFEQWCAKNAVPFIEMLTPPLLARYREAFVGQPAHREAKGRRVGRGRRKPVTRKKSPAQQNKQLNSLRVVLTQLRREGKVPELNSDSIKDSLRFVKRRRAKREFLDTKQVKALLESALRYDADGHDPIAPFTAFLLLTGMRFNEAASLTWRQVNVAAREIFLSAAGTKTSCERTVRLDKMPSLIDWLSREKLTAGSAKRVFPRVTAVSARAARNRLQAGYSAPTFTWHQLRATAGTYAVCGSLYGAGSEHECAQQLGHSIAVAQAHYTGRARDFLPGAESLEEALRCADLFKQIAGVGAEASAAASAG